MVTTVALPRAHDRLSLATATRGGGAALGRLLRLGLTLTLLGSLLPLVTSGTARRVPVRVRRLLSGRRVVEGAAACAALFTGASASNGRQRAGGSLAGGDTLLGKAGGVTVLVLPLAAATALVVGLLVIVRVVTVRLTTLAVVAKDLRRRGRRLVRRLASVGLGRSCLARVVG